MTQQTNGIRVGETVPEFEMDTFEPARGDFGRIRLQDLKSQDRWTLLFFYPADFTFV